MVANLQQLDTIYLDATGTLAYPTLQMKGRCETNFMAYVFTEMKLYSLVIFNYISIIIMFSLPISTFMYRWAIYIFLWSVCLFCCSQICRQTNPGNIKIRSQIHECRKWEWGRAVSFLGTHKLDFWYRATIVNKDIQLPYISLSNKKIS